MMTKRSKGPKRHQKKTAALTPKSPLPEPVTRDEFLHPEGTPSSSASGSRSVSVSQYQGPIPPPSILEQYDKVVPGSAELIIQQFEKQSNHRMTLESTVIQADIKRANLGLLAGFLLCIATVIGGCVVAVLSHAGAGATIATAAVGTLAAVFVYGTASRKKERQDRVKALAPRED